MEVNSKDNGAVSIPPGLFPWFPELEDGEYLKEANGDNLKVVNGVSLKVDNGVSLKGDNGDNLKEVNGDNLKVLLLVNGGNLKVLPPVKVDPLPLKAAMLLSMWVEWKNPKFPSPKLPNPPLMLPVGISANAALVETRSSTMKMAKKWSKLNVSTEITH